MCVAHLCVAVREREREREKEREREREKDCRQRDVRRCKSCKLVIARSKVASKPAPATPAVFPATPSRNVVSKRFLGSAKGLEVLSSLT